MQTQKWVNFGLLLGGAIIFLFLSKLTTAVWDLSRLPLLEEWPVDPPYLIGFGIAAGMAVWVRRNDGTNNFLNEVALELSRVTWPGRKETVASAGVVVVLIGIAALILFLIDTLWGTMIRGVLPI
jgi:preprotein translocase subunit SecE